MELSVNSTVAGALEDNQESDHTGTKYGLSGLGLFLGVVIVVIIIKRKLRKKDYNLQLTNLESRYQPTGETWTGPTVDDVIRRWVKDPQLLAEISEVLIDNRCLLLGDRLGSGQFGCVYEGIFYTGMTDGSVTQKVAIKVLKDSNIDDGLVAAFLREGMIMKGFNHENVLGLTGVTFSDEGVPMIVLPYMAMGNLKDHISLINLQISVRRLLMFGLDVCSGMRYLAYNRFVHRDLAARNCMLDDQLQVKVADFGLSRDIYSQEYYSSEDSKTKLPVKWMALESLTKGVYTSMSDVWSYGVLLWELLTRGVTPYPDITNWDVREYIQDGRRLDQPDACPDYIYAMMLNCWLEIPEHRPTFMELEDELETILNYDVTGTECDIQGQKAGLHINVLPLTPPSSPTEDIKSPFRTI